MTHDPWAVPHSRGTGSRACETRWWWRSGSPSANAAYSTLPCRIFPKVYANTVCEKFAARSSADSAASVAPREVPSPQSCRNRRRGSPRSHSFAPLRPFRLPRSHNLPSLESTNLCTTTQCPPCFVANSLFPASRRKECEEHNLILSVPWMITESNVMFRRFRFDSVRAWHGRQEFTMALPRSSTAALEELGKYL